MKPGLKVAAKLKNNKWVVATIGEKNNLIRKKSIETLSTVKDDGFITLKQYLKNTKDATEPDVILTTLGCSSLYIQYEEELNPEETKTTKSFEKIWWAKANEVCKSCKKKCKQSSKVSLVYCPTFTKG